MKTCPFCKAEIEDNARFCLYCMRPLEDKQVVTAVTKKRWLWPVLIGGLLVLLLLVWLLLPKDTITPPGDPIEPPVLEDTTLPEATAEPTHSATEGTTAPEETTHVPATQDSPPPITNPSSDAEPPVTPTQVVTEPEVTVPETTHPETTAPDTTVPDTTVPDTTVPDTTQAETAPPEATHSPVNPANAVVYSYRPAEKTDDLNASYTNPGDHIVITGVRTPSTNGEYIIPAYIDGLRVIAVDKFAFQGVYVRKILISDGVKNLASYSFSSCTELTDIYIEGSSVHIPTDAVAQPADRTGILTFHCSADCHDRLYNFFKTGAEYWFGGQYEEWNG